MLYFDYIWDLHKDRIILDQELNTDQLGWKSGDYFRVEKRDGKTQLIKIDLVEKFVLDGGNNDKE